MTAHAADRPFVCLGAGHLLLVDEALPCSSDAPGRARKEERRRCTSWVAAIQDGRSPACEARVYLNAGKALTMHAARCRDPARAAPPPRADCTFAPRSAATFYLALHLPHACRHGDLMPRWRCAVRGSPPGLLPKLRPGLRHMAHGVCRKLCSHRRTVDAPFAVSDADMLRDSSVQEFAQWNVRRQVATLHGECGSLVRQRGLQGAISSLRAGRCAAAPCCLLSCRQCA